MSRGKYLWQYASSKQIDVYPAEKRRFPDWRVDSLHIRTYIHTHINIYIYIHTCIYESSNIHDSSLRKCCFTFSFLSLACVYSRKSSVPGCIFKNGTRISSWSNFLFAVAANDLCISTIFLFLLEGTSTRMSIDYFYLSGEVRELKICLEVPGKCELSGIWINGHFPWALITLGREVSIYISSLRKFCLSLQFCYCIITTILP